MKYSIEFLEDIKGEEYNKLINYAFSQCDKFGLVRRTEIEPTEKCIEFLRNSQKTLLELKQLTEWPGTVTFGEKHAVYFYKTTEENRKLLMMNDSIYSWLNPDFPEDLFFIRRGKTFISSTAHEQLGSVILDNEIELEDFESKFNFKYKVVKR